MRQKLIIDGNAVYEIDEGCMRRKRMGRGRESCLPEKTGEGKEGQGHMHRKPDKGYK